MLWNAGLGVYHSGIEWKWWPGPQECSGELGDIRAGGPLIKQLETMSVVRCDEAAWRFLGLSIAEWSLACFAGLTAYAVWLAFSGKSPSQ